MVGSEDENNTITKERRYLFILSFLIIVNYFENFSLEEINILGNTLTLDKPVILYGVIVLVWMYFYLNYFQSFKEKYSLTYWRKFNEILKYQFYSKAKVKFEEENHNHRCINKELAIELNKFGIINLFNSSIYLDGQAVVNSETDINSQEVNLKALTITLIYLSSAFSFIFNTKEFLKNYLPLLVGFIAFIFIFLTILYRPVF